MPERIARAVRVPAFAPLPGESLDVMVPPHFVALSDDIAAAHHVAATLPFSIRREAFIDDADLARAPSGVRRVHAPSRQDVACHDGTVPASGGWARTPVL